MSKIEGTSYKLREVCAFDKNQGMYHGLPYVGLEHIESNTGRFIGSLDAVKVKSNTFCFTNKSVLYGRLRPYLNKVLCPNFNGHCSTEIFSFVPNSLLERRYLFYWFLLDETANKINETCTGARMPRANMNEVMEFEVFVPSRPEQKRIASILDEAFEGIAISKANAEQNLNNSRALFASELSAVFDKSGVNVVSLSDITSEISDGDHMPPPKSDEGVPFITIGNVDKNTRKIDFSDTFKVPHAYFDALKYNKKPKIGDVLYTVTGSFGIPVLIRDEIDFCFQRHIGLIRPKTQTNSTWLYYLLMSPQVFRQASEGATGTAQKTVSLKLLRSFQVPLVSISEQVEDVAKLDAVFEESQRLESIYRRKLAALDELKKALLHKAFAGEL